RNYSFEPGGELILHIAAGVQPTQPRWLSRLVANLLIPGVGASGGLVRDADGRIVSAGIVHGLRDGTAPGPAFEGLPCDAISYYFYAEVTRNVSAVSGQCLLVRERDAGSIKFGGNGWDLDLCGQLQARGLRCVHVGGAELRQSQIAAAPLATTGKSLR